jgi:hypothetical protein
MVSLGMVNAPFKGMCGSSPVPDPVSVVLPQKALDTVLRLRQLWSAGLSHRPRTGDHQLNIQLCHDVYNDAVIHTRCAGPRPHA